MMPASTPSTPKRKFVPSLRYLIVLILLGLAVHVILPQIATLEHSLQIIRGMLWWAVALAVSTQVLSYLSSGYLLKTLVAASKQRLSVLRGAAIFVASSSMGTVAGGPVSSVTASFRWARGSGVSPEGAMLASLLPTVFYDSTMAMMGMIGLIQLLTRHELSALQTIGFGFTLLALSVIAGVVIWGTHHRDALTTLVGGLAGRWAALRHRPYDPTTTETAISRWFSAWDTLRTGGWHGPMLGAILSTSFDILTLYFLFVAAGHQISPGILLAGYGLPLLLGKVSILPGGVGIVEATMAALYTGLGVPNGATVVVILIYRFLSFWLPLLIGLPIIPYLQHSSHHIDDSVTLDSVKR